MQEVVAFSSAHCPSHLRDLAGTVTHSPQQRDVVAVRQQQRDLLEGLQSISLRLYFLIEDARNPSTHLLEEVSVERGDVDDLAVRDELLHGRGEVGKLEE